MPTSSCQRPRNRSSPSRAVFRHGYFSLRRSSTRSLFSRSATRRRPCPLAGQVRQGAPHARVWPQYLFDHSSNALRPCRAAFKPAFVQLQRSGSRARSPQTRRNRPNHHSDSAHGNLWRAHHSPVEPQDGLSLRLGPTSFRFLERLSSPGPRQGKDPQSVKLLRRANLRCRREWWFYSHWRHAPVRLSSQSLQIRLPHRPSYPARRRPRLRRLRPHPPPLIALKKLTHFVPVRRDTLWHSPKYSFLAIRINAQLVGSKLFTI